MPNGERMNSGENHEASAETPRAVLEARGEKANNAAVNTGIEHVELPEDLDSLSREQIWALYGQSTAEFMAIAEEKAKLGRETAAKLERERMATEAAASATRAATETFVAAEAPDVNASAESPVSETTDSTGTGEANDSDVVDDDTAEAIIANPESISEEEAKATLEKAKKSGGLKHKLTKVLITILVVVLAGLAGFGIGQHLNKADTPPTTITAVGEQNEARGIVDGYGETGMWLSKNKSGSYNFAAAGEVAEVNNRDEKEMIKYTAGNQVESFADYLTGLPEELQPEGFKGLSLKECEEKLESLTKEEYDAVRAQFDRIIDQAIVRETTLNGTYYNAFMRLGDASGDVVHENMELVACKTRESGYRATEFVWYEKDGGKLIGTMMVKIEHDKDGNIIGGCIQVVEPEGKNPGRLDELPTVDPEDPTPVTPDPTNPDPTNPDPDPVDPDPVKPEPVKPAPKNPENLERIDEQINEDIAEDIGTGDVEITPTPEVKKEDLTPKPTGSDFEGTAPTIVENDASKKAENVGNNVSPENNYSENRGGAHDSEYAPVVEDDAAQAAADAAEIPVNEAPTSGDDLADILADLGIN